MVKVREHAPITAAGELDTEAWISAIVEAGTHVDAARLARLCEFVRGFGDSPLLAGADMAQLVAGVGMDEASVQACLLYRLMRDDLVDDDLVDDDLVDSGASDVYSSDAAALTQAVLRIGRTSLLELDNSRLLTSEAKDQLENVRRMLVSLIDDPRAAIIKLSERIVALRRAKHDDTERQLRVAREALFIFAPLANRLGIWRFKWELEDLALRYLEPSRYQLIAASLDGRREEREREVRETASVVAQALEEKGIRAELGARAKHIYSIYQKMRKKNISFDAVYDVRAIRILVNDMADCYAALGVVHSLFRHVPHEFDDYIANPKENGYQSIHTAVIGPNGKTLEVQIRTFEMHDQSEIGVCAHWDYKEGAVEHLPYADKMNWFRQMLELEDDPDDVAGVLRQEVVDERVYINTPQGHVLDLPLGATALDFAYRVHTHVGHCATGCEVDGTSRPLNYVLSTGQTVSVRTQDDEHPEREWLERSLGFAQTSRARAKIHAWFRVLPKSQLTDIGRTLMSAYAERLAVALPDDLPARLDCTGWPDLFEVVGRGDLQCIDIADQIELGSGQLSLLEAADRGDDYIVQVSGVDREGLLHDVTSALGDMGLSLLSITGGQAGGRAELTLTTRAENLRTIALLIDQLRKIPGILEAKRTL